jgi:DNA-binding IclR family transcriptional regulator
MEFQTAVKGPRPKNVIQSLERAAHILDALSHFPQGLSLRDLSERVSLSKGTTHRILSSLSYLDFIRQNPLNKHYQLGFKLVELGNYLLSQIDFRTEARPFLAELAERVRETVHMVILEKDEVLYIDKVEASGHPSSLRMVSMLGARVPAHCCAVGKVLLAALPAEKIVELAERKGLARRTRYTIVDLEQLLEHLKMVQQQGYALDNEENEIGIRCVAAPVYNQTGSAIAAISLSVPAIRIKARELETNLKDQVVRTAMTISHKLGYPGGQP